MAAVKLINYYNAEYNNYHEFILSFQNIDNFDDIGPCVILASPGMMQSGLSRQLFEAWCTDKRNGVIVAGYCVEGTLAKVNRYIY